MVTDAIEVASPPPYQNTQFGQSRHFYVAVDRIQFKMDTLVDLLSLADRRPCLPMIICCSTRDELDAICSTVSRRVSYGLFKTHRSCDLAESERALILEKYRQMTTRWNQLIHSQEGNEDETGKDEHSSHMLVVTDACLPLIASGESPISGRLLINYELPAKKETYMRRMAACLAADGVVINMVVGGEVVNLKNIEESSNIIMAEMPINIYEIL